MYYIFFFYWYKRHSAFHILGIKVIIITLDDISVVGNKVLIVNTIKNKYNTFKFQKIKAMYQHYNYLSYELLDDYSIKSLNGKLGYEKSQEI